MFSATQKKTIKKLFTITTLFFTPIFISAVNAYSFLDEIPFYYDFFALALIYCSLFYLAACLFFKKKKFSLFMYLLTIGSIQLLAGIILFICFYGYAFPGYETKYIHYDYLPYILD